MFGKLIGGLLGLITFSLPGAIIGLFIGHQFDKGFKNLRQSDSPEAIKALQESFFNTTFTLIGYLAKADGRVTQEEITLTEQLMAKMELNADNKREAIRLFKIGATPEYNPNELIAQFNTVCGARVQLKRTLMLYLFNTALADGEFSQAEEIKLREIAQALEISTFVFEQLLKMIKAQASFSGGQYQQHHHQQQAPTQNELDAAYEALGVQASATDSEIKKAYRKLMSEYHPDKLMGQGVPEDMIKVATERSQEVQTAYDIIKKHRKK